MLVVGIDVYNVEAEAMGCRVIYFENSNACPAIIDPLIASGSELAGIHVPDPESEGRMPLYLQVAEALHRELGTHMIVRGSVTGPFTLAATLLGAEKYAIATVEEPQLARDLLTLCSQATVRYGKAFLRRGVEPVIFDSRATPLLASPRVFREMVKPVYRDFIFPELQAAGGRFLPLIIGGDTTAIIGDLIETGATQLLCDPPSRLDGFLEICRNAGVPFRANVDARLVNCGREEGSEHRATEILQHCGGYPGLILGCGIVGYDCPKDRVLAIKRAITAFTESKSGVQP
jgi:uroporphyrinogen decarboxylase